VFNHTKERLGPRFESGRGYFCIFLAKELIAILGSRKFNNFLGTRGYFFLFFDSKLLFSIFCLIASTANSALERKPSLSFFIRKSISFASSSGMPIFVYFFLIFYTVQVNKIFLYALLCIYTQ